MTDLLPDSPLLSAFLIASLLLAVTPGPGVLYIVARSLVQGPFAGLASVAGVALGNLGNALAAVLGLTALFAVSSLAFSFVKYAGAAYLVWLGVQILRGTHDAKAAGTLDASPLARLFRDGFVVALLNPKTTVFFAAFLPQFLDAGAPLMQGMLLGTLFVVIAGVTDSAYALVAGTVAPWLRSARARQHGQWLGGSLFIGLGLFAALSDPAGQKRAS
jgi:threonine/homoserine/homoserine lactone efflux protein